MFLAILFSPTAATPPTYTRTELTADASCATAEGRVRTLRMLANTMAPGASASLYEVDAAALPADRWILRGHVVRPLDGEALLVQCAP